MSKLITVTGVNGRLAYSQAVGGKVIPHDKSVTLPDSLWLQQRLAVGDIETVTLKRVPKPTKSLTDNNS